MIIIYLIIIMASIMINKSNNFYLLTFACYRLKHMLFIIHETHTKQLEASYKTFYFWFQLSRNCNSTAQGRDGEQLWARFQPGHPLLWPLFGYLSLVIFGSLVQGSPLWRFAQHGCMCAFRTRDAFLSAVAFFSQV